MAARRGIDGVRRHLRLQPAVGAARRARPGRDRGAHGPHQRVLRVGDRRGRGPRRRRPEDRRRRRARAVRGPGSRSPSSGGLPRHARRAPAPVRRQHGHAGAAADVDRCPHRAVHVPDDRRPPPRARRLRRRGERGPAMREGGQPRPDGGQRRVGRRAAALGPRRAPPRRRPPRSDAAADGRPPAGAGVAEAGAVPDLADYVPAAQRALLSSDLPGEHRQCAISFLSIAGTDDLLAADGPDALSRRCSRASPTPSTRRPSVGARSS